MDFSKIKLIIWDLDETFWKGTLSDNDKIILKDELIEFVNAALDRGIVHSICSKNDFDTARAFLEDNGLWDLFVFPSINWEPKGKRVMQILGDMKLRSQNTLFVDDNLSNLREAVYYCPELQTCTPEELADSLDRICLIPAKDPDRTRLLQYRLLEEKNASQKAFSSNEEFLKSCNIRVGLHEDCLSQLDRIHELILRTNQLNYTKFRQDIKDLEADLKNPGTKAAYVTVKDDFGDYGIVGFYMIVNGKVVHYLFSCRTLGMLVEQYVYMQLGCPEIAVSGEVVTQLNRQVLPDWINQAGNAHAQGKQKMHTGEQTVLFKGPCDISQIFSFIEESGGVATEFSYVNDRGYYVEGYNHTAQIATALLADESHKQKLIDSKAWLDAPMLDASKWKSSDAIVFSMLTDGNLGVYQHKETGWKIALCEKYYDLTDPQNWDDYIAGNIFTSSIGFTEESLREFSKNYRYVSDDKGDVTLSNLEVLYGALKKEAKLMLILGSEIPYEKNTNPSYAGRHGYHRILNEKLRAWAADKPNVHLIEVTKYIQSQKDFTDTINHFQKKVYFSIAQEIISILGGTEQTIKVKSKWFLRVTVLRQKLKKLAKRLFKRRK